MGTPRGLKKVWSGRVSWDDRVVEPSKDRVERHCEQEDTRRAALPDTSGHVELSYGFPCKLNLRSAINTHRPQESINEPWQFRLVEDVEDPRVVDARKCSG